MFAVKAKIYGVLYKQSSSITLMKHLGIGQRQKAHNFSAFHWPPHGSLVSIGQHFVTTRVVYLPKRTKTSLITKSDQSGPNNQLLQLCTTCTAWSDSDQAVRAVHSCNSWFLLFWGNKLTSPNSFDRISKILNRSKSTTYEQKNIKIKNPKL